ncbi:MAG: hypothetical protein Q8P60_06300 [Pseudorhodobacter sp.]|nr:hypothetical protein [Pseudorhodobacter sp.]
MVDLHVSLRCDAGCGKGALWQICRVLAPSKARAGVQPHRFQPRGTWSRDGATNSVARIDPINAAAEAFAVPPAIGLRRAFIRQVHAWAVEAAFRHFPSIPLQPGCRPEKFAFLAAVIPGLSPIFPQNYPQPSGDSVKRCAGSRVKFILCRQVINQTKVRKFSLNREVKYDSLSW